METQPNLKLLGVLENISHYFDFLSSRGFHRVSVIFSDQECETWQVTLMTDDCIIKIYRYEGKVELALSTLQLYHAVGLFALDDLIYWVNGNKDLFDPLQEILMNEKQIFERLAWRLEKHIDSILNRIRKVLVLPSTDHASITLNTHSRMFQNN